LVVAGVLIKTAAGKTKKVVETLRKTERVAYAYAVFGRYDIVAMVKDARDLDEAAQIITEKIAKVDGVTNTETLIVANI